MSRKHRRTSAKMTAIFAGISAAIVLGGGVAVASEYKTVSVTVDGATRQVQTMNRTVGQVVSDMGIKVGQYDQVIPALGSQMSRNQEIKIVHARPVVLQGTKDAKIGWGVSNQDAPQLQATFRVDGGEVSGSYKEGADPRAAAQAAGIELAALDRVTVEKTSQDAATIRVSRVERGVSKEEKVSAPPVKEVDDKNLEPGKKVVEDEGKEEVVAKSTFVEKVDGQVAFKSPEQVTTLVKAEPKIVRVGPADTSSDTDYGPVVPAGEAQEIAHEMVIARGWSESDFACLVNLWNRESGWNSRAENRSSGAYGIPQSLPANKMASAGADWRTNPATQIRWGLDYIAGRYGNPTKAWEHWKKAKSY
ncbi:ubiquitin-like domain-containing protein [uncultured Varibaculum sp.]|uniref:aggregation-promoting factor C-terminal-like domain-containing protein n=1 Tax=uncultured Varibaculum sp. TaxID=413896 RepID=UPI002594529A|nr:ubiquitin-like domain-containing protein [uncultured Varibaculum sp.]